jgi:hypothetical protein
MENLACDVSLRTPDGSFDYKLFLATAPREMDPWGLEEERR